MKKIFLLSKQNIDLAKEELLALTKSKKSELQENLLILNTEKDLIKAFIIIGSESFSQ